MNAQELKKISNPYYPITHKLKGNDFVGRDLAINELIRGLDRYKETSELKNILIGGEKSIGKSTLLHRYKQILDDYNFLIYETTELSRDKNVKIDEFEFFKEFFKEIFDKYGVPEGTLFDIRQAEIWYSLTSDKYDHESSYLERQIEFATIYSNVKKGTEEILSYKTIESDLEKIMDQLLFKTNSDFIGLVILIDEFQELERNTNLLDILRKLSENLPGLLIVAAGLPTFLNNPSFEKFCRTAIPINLKPMNNNEILDLITKPIEKVTKCTRHEVQRKFDSKSLKELLERTNGNPLHVRVLCAMIFDVFQGNKDQESLMINREVMDKVMEYYSNMSEKSRKIKNALESCSQDKLKSFSHIYFYDGINLKTAIQIKLAFNSIQESSLQEIKKKFCDDISDIFDLGLFTFGQNKISHQEIEAMSVDQLAHIEIDFIGDAIDKLYAAYYYEDLTQKPLLLSGSKKYEDLLTFKLARKIDLSAAYSQIHNSISMDKMVISINNEKENKLKNVDEILKDYDMLVRDAQENEGLSESKQKRIKEITDLYDLSLAAQYAEFFDFVGYYLLIADVTVRGKRKIITNLLPVEGNEKQLISIKERIEDYTKILNASLDDYMIKINSMYLYSLPRKPLLMIYIIDLNHLNSELYAAFGVRDFTKAYHMAANIFQLSMSFKENKLFNSLKSSNDYSFIMINVGDLEGAKVLLMQTHEKYLLSKFNLATVYFLEKKYGEAKNELQKLARKKQGETAEASYLHLFFNYPINNIKYLICEDVSTVDVMNWNLALLYSIEKLDRSVTNSFLNKIKSNSKNKFINERVKCWVKYYYGEVNNATIGLKSLLNDKLPEYLKDSIQADINLISNL